MVQSVELGERSIIDGFSQGFPSSVQVHDRISTDRISLQNMEKKAIETFREYAHKWRDLAAQVQPPMTDKELNKMFLNTLKAPYYDRMIENLS